MSNLEKVKRHLSKPIPISLKNEDGLEDVFYFKPMNVEQQAILMELSKDINKREKIVVNEKEVPNVSKEDMTGMFELILDVVKNSMEELDEETARDFTNNNFDQLSEKLDKLIPNRSNSDLDSLKKAKERIQSGQQAKTE